VVGGVGQVVVDELPHLHQQQRVGGVRPVDPACHQVADLSGSGQLQIISLSLTRKINRTSSILRQQYSLEWSSCSSIVRVLQVVTSAINGSKIILITNRSRINPWTQLSDSLVSKTIKTRS